MKVALDAQLSVGSATGIGEYVRGLEAALREEGADVVALCEPRLDPWRFDRRLLWDQVLLPRRARRSGAELLHCASGTMPLRCPLPSVVTVHDVAWLRVQHHTRWYARRYFGPFSLARYRHAAAIITDSVFSRDELLDVLPALDPARVHAIYPGVASAFGGVVRQPDRRTILVVGSVEPRKNLAHLVRLLPRLPQARVVSVGPATPYLQACRRVAEDLGVAARFEFHGYVTREALMALYASAAVAAVPSFYEGFGYAAAQALCAGLPCVVSDRASLPEVAGDDAPVLPLEDEDGWSEALARALAGNDDAHAASARARCAGRFSWAQAAHTTRSVYESVDG